MKKLFLLPLVAIGLALIPAKQADAQVTIGVGGSELDSVTLDTGTATTVIRDITDITRAAITATTLAIRTIEPITPLPGRTTTVAIEITVTINIIEIITTATN